MHRPVTGEPSWFRSFVVFITLKAYAFESVNLRLNAAFNK